MPEGYGARRPSTPRGGTAAPAAASGLNFPSLPGISELVPGTIEPARNRRSAAMLAQFLLDAGIITARRLCPAPSNLQGACQYAFDRWLAAAVGEVTCFTPAFALQLDSAATDTHEALAPSTVELCWKEGSVCHWGVGAGLDYLEACVPLLGCTVLDVMEHKGAHAYPLFTPGMALDEASYLYWRGEEDEALALEEDCGDDQAARDAMMRDMVTRGDFSATFPAWALDYNRPRLTSDALSAVAATHACPYVRRAAALTFALDGTRTTAQYCPEEDGPFIGFGAVLCWREGDLAVQVSDDYANLAWQGEYCDEIGKVTFDLADPAAMRCWLRKIKPNLTAIGVLDALLRHLSDRE